MVPFSNNLIEFTRKHGKVKIAKIDIQTSGIYVNYEVENPLDQLQDFIILDDSGRQSTRTDVPVRTEKDPFIPLP